MFSGDSAKGGAQSWSGELIERRPVEPSQLDAMDKQGISDTKCVCSRDYGAQMRSFPPKAVSLSLSLYVSVCLSLSLSLSLPPLCQSHAGIYLVCLVTHACLNLRGMTE